MATGVTNTTVPVADDVKLGEFLLYANYQTPRQFLMGASQGGLKLDLKRAIKSIKSDGQYGNIKGLRRYEMFDAIATVEALTLKYCNSKKISTVETDDNTWVNQDWDLTGGTYTAESTIVNTGLRSAKCTANTNQHGIHSVFTVAKDLTVFDNAEASGTGDYIGLAIYISTQDKTDLDAAKIRLFLHNDAENVMTNYVYYDIDKSTLTADAWTSLKIPKSSFLVQGAGAFTGVTGISLNLNGVPSAEVVFYVDSVYLIQNTTNGVGVPIVGSGHGFTMTDEGTYKKFIPNLEILDSDYFDNIAIVGQKLDGKAFIFIMHNVLNDGNIQKAFKDKDEVVTSVQLKAHYERTKQTTVPIIMRDYDV